MEKEEDSILEASERERAPRGYERERYISTRHERRYIIGCPVYPRIVGAIVRNDDGPRPRPAISTSTNSLDDRSFPRDKLAKITTAKVEHETGHN